MQPDPGGRERRLRAEIRQLLAELELVSHGSTTSFDPTGGGHGFGPTEGRVPGGLRRDGDDHEWFRRRFVGAVSVRALEGVLQDLKEALHRAKFAPVSKIDCSTREGKLRIGMDPRPVDVLMSVYGYSRAQIYRFKKEARELEAELSRKAA